MGFQHDVIIRGFSCFLTVGQIILELKVGQIILELKVDQIILELKVDQIILELKVDQIILELKVDQIVLKLKVPQIVLKLKVDQIVLKCRCSQRDKRVNFKMSLLVNVETLLEVIRISWNGDILEWGYHHLTGKLFKNRYFFGSFFRDLRSRYFCLRFE